MPSGEHQDGAASADVSESATRAGTPTDPARPVRITPAPRSDPGEAEQHVQAALAAGTRTGASLSAVFRAVQAMTDGLSGAQEANRQLVEELETMHRLLAERTEENAALAGQLAALEGERDHALREVEQMRADAEREREFLVDEQDRFLAALLEDHEQALDALRRERDEARTRAAGRQRDAPTNPGRPVVSDEQTPDTSQELIEARRTIERLMTERNRSREMLRRLQAQRDEAQSALASRPAEEDQPLNVTVKAERAGQNQDAITTEPPVPHAKRPATNADARKTAPHQGPRVRVPDESSSERTTDPLPRSALAQALEASRPAHPDANDAAKANAATTARPPVGAAPRRSTEPGIAAPTPPPEELRAAITSVPEKTTQPEGQSPATTDGKPPIKRKPDPTTRPIGGYSLGEGEIKVERVGGALGSPKPPNR